MKTASKKVLLSVLRTALNLKTFPYSSDDLNKMGCYGYSRLIKYLKDSEIISQNKTVLKSFDAVEVCKSFECYVNNRIYKRQEILFKKHSLSGYSKPELLAELRRRGLFV